ncbi:MAG: D-2-hydroxyacid dehydrogenase [Gammaproteobacteria bacterium]|nr:D-2-hydroxyacid dehydrogenase [Gammaproteobacteria bacterium]
MSGSAPAAVFLDYETIHPVDLDGSVLTRLLPDMVVYPDTPHELLVERIGDAGIVLLNKVELTREIIGKCPRLRLICLAATGVDNVDVAAAKERGIGVVNIRNYCAPSVVQHVFALLLALNQRLREYDELLAGGAWEQSTGFCVVDYPFRELQGLTLGIVGLGNLGRRVAEVAQAFGMRVIAGQRPYSLESSGACTTGPDGIERALFADLLAQSHVISLHCPLTAETRGLINATTLSLMQPGALLINTARGALIVPDALIEALRSGRLGGAGIDVLEREPPVHGHPFLDVSLRNLIVTPHMAWAARESRQRALDEMALNVRDFLAGGQRNRVDLGV